MSELKTLHGDLDEPLGVRCAAVARKHAFARDYETHQPAAPLGWF